MSVQDPERAGQDPEPEPELGGTGLQHPVGDREGWRPVIMGQLVEPLVPPHPEPPEAAEDELTRAALEDPAALAEEPHSAHPHTWRLVFLVLLAVVALSMVFRFAR